MAMLAPRTRRFTPPALGPWTYEQYCALPDDGKRYEVIWGELYVTAAPNEDHQTFALNLASILNDFVRRYRLGKVLVAPFDVLLSEQNIVQPDILFISTEQSSIRTGANAQGSPDLVVEILSPSTRRRDLGIKRDTYAYHGVQHYWLVDPARRTLEAYKLREADYILGQRCTGDEVFTSALFPGLSIPLGPLWS